MPETAEPDPRWPHVLDRMEDDIARAHTDMQDRTAPFTAELMTPPADLGPIHPELMERAGAVAAAQQALMSSMAAFQRSLGQQMSALHAVPPARNRSAAIYLDVAM